MLNSRLAMGLLLTGCFSLQVVSAEEPKANEKTVVNPAYTVWSKVAVGTTITYSLQKVNVKVGPSIRHVSVVSVSEKEVVLSCSSKEKGQTTIPAKILAENLPKDEATADKKEFEFKDGSKFTATKVLRKEIGQPDTHVWIGTEVPSGIVEREWEEKPHGTLVEKILSFQIPGSAVKEFKKYIPKEGAYILEPEAPELKESNQPKRKEHKEGKEGKEGKDLEGNQQIQQMPICRLPVVQDKESKPEKEKKEKESAPKQEQ
jgi:hypothetical protein